jgi:MraZ protein
MVTFYGKYPARIDDKGRIVFPAAIRKDMPSGGDMRFVIKKSIYDSCLEMYTFEEWTRQADKIKESLDFFNPDHVTFWREFMRDVDIVEPDSKLGRISISRELLDAIGITKDVVFFGVGFKLEVWAKEGFENSRIAHDSYISIAKSLSKK